MEPMHHVMLSKEATHEPLISRQMQGGFVATKSHPLPPQLSWMDGIARGLHPGRRL